MRLPIVAFLIAVVLRLLTKTFRNKHRITAIPALHIKVLLTARVDDAWRDTVWNVITQSHYPRALQFGVLLECTKPSDADMSDVEPDLRGLVRVTCAKAGPDPEDVPRRTRRLLRRFVAGDETLIVVMDVRTRVVHAWDVTLADLMRNEPPDTVLSTPACVKEGRIPSFPTLRKRSTGTVAREKARFFEGPLTTSTVPTVCWCAEFTAARPEALTNWPPAHIGKSALACTTVPGRHFVVPTVSLVEHDEALEESHLDTEEGTDAPFGPYERIGLTREKDDTEGIRKFGSSRAAALALEFS